MTVIEMRRMLEKYPDDMEVLNGRCSDYGVVMEDEWYIVQGVPTDYGVMRSHDTMSAENKAKEKDYLYLEGN